MRKFLLGSAASLVLLGSALPAQAQFFAKPTESQALTVDNRGVLTMAPLLERVTPAVVSIETASKITASTNSRGSQSQRQMLERFFGELPEGMFPDADEDADSSEQGEDLGTRRNSIGSGVIVDAGNGYIITNHHVIKGADEIFVVLADRRQLEAELVGSDSKTDIAVLKVKSDNLTSMPFARSSDVKVGDYTIAIGNPFGLGHTVTQGIVSAKGREFQRGGQYEDFIQTDASINPGNSGGALINSKGELIGINTAIMSRSGGNNGIGFAVPSRMAQSVMEQILENGEVQRGRIGVLIQDITPDLYEALDLPTRNGALVSSVTDGGAAERAGLTDGDIITAFNGEDIFDSSDIRNAVGYVRPGTKADITYLRDGRKRTTKIDVDVVEEEREVLTADASDDIPAMESFSGATLTEIPDTVKLRGGDKGVYVSRVARGSKAARAGLTRGDVIREVDRKDVANLRDFEKAITDKDGPIAITVERDGQTIFLAVR